MVGRELRATLLDYLRSTWSLADRRTEEALFAFLSGAEGLFQGPYLRLGMPFAPAPKGAAIPLDVAPPYPPHLHQLQAWQRLSSRGQTPRATLVTTGTGSGKTECFLYPLLDHAYREALRKSPGIKAIVLYPMNALAADQAGRFASTIWNDERLRGRIRVGLFVGGHGVHREMGPDHVVDDNDRLRAEPPDILLTNYRMLDLLLQRPKDARLWAHNRPDTLRYLVLDELHTYDGAQGTDVACLIRRLGQRLGSAEALCPVGTSATVGGGPGASGAIDTRKELLEFAGTLFDQRFQEDAFIGETRQSPDELSEALGCETLLPETVPSRAGPWPQPGEKAEEHVSACAEEWLPPEARALVMRPGSVERLDRVELGRWVLRLPITRALLDSAHRLPRSADELDATLRTRLPRFAAGTTPERQGWLASALSLLSYAQRDVGGHALPLVSVQVTLWVREVRRLLAKVSAEPAFRFLDDAPPPEGEAWLPRYDCQDCGHGGWLVTESGPGDTLGLAYRDIARAFQERADDLRLLHIDGALSEDLDAPPVSSGSESDGPAPSGGREPSRAGVLTARTAFLDAAHRRLLDRAPDAPALRASMPRVNVALFEDDRCPACGGRHSLRMLGARSTTLSSVAVGHLFTTPLNTDRKLLTFSDSVQDAAHRAGFFGARTYRFALRSAVLAAVPPDGPGAETISLADLGDAAWAHWTARLGKKGLSPTAELTALLLPTDLHWLATVQDWHAQLDELVKRKQLADRDGEAPDLEVPDPSEALVEDVKRRLRWECTRELGVAARIGRTLEQSGCVSVTVDEAPFRGAVDEIAFVLRERLGLLITPEATEVAGMVAGLVTRLRLRGGVHDPLLEGYVRNAGEGFFLSKAKAPLLSPFTRDSSRPIFLTNAPKSRRFESISSTHKGTWATDWLVRSLGVPREAAVAAQAYALIATVLTKHGLLVSFETEERGPVPGTKSLAWGLAPERLRVSRAHVFRKCNACGYELAAVEASVTDPLSRPCLRYRCTGRFEVQVEREPDVDELRARDLPVASYYKRFYERGQLGRLWSKEHTGLLARGPREELELEFKQRPRPDSPNLLSCTPTLEMGIDIGDLSATLLCSVPPRASSYVQRVGRAGRKTGNALVLAFAATRPHDLYFFQAPLEAMAGTVQPPGCYLSAPEVLKRQALAFVFDGHARGGGLLPGRVDDLWKASEKKKFPDAVLEAFAPRREKLQQAFVEMFGKALTDTARRHVAAFFTVEADGVSPLERTLLDVTKDARERREELKRLAQKLAERERELKAESVEAKKVLDADDERRRIEDELRFTYQQLRSLGEKDLFGWLTEEGCLPNYAFPERGVKLDAYIRREGLGREPEHHEWVRAPSAALTELAPFNSFYASSRRVKIDGIELRRAHKPVDWRFCRNCHHAEIASAVGEEAVVCPSCGDPHFADVGLRRTVVTLGQVFSVTRHRDAVLGDDGDDRERGFYERARLFEAKAKAREAWSNDAAGFGFELQDELMMRELNLGPKAQRGTPQTFRIAGRDAPDVRFVLCAECGQAHLPERGPRMGPPRERHRAWCPERKKAEDKQRFREVHLLRELKSEALRLVVPNAAGEDPARDLANLSAALRLGLRRFYGGEPEFLEVHAYDEPLPAEEGRRRYVVVMDRVPGGTGLLAELALEKGRALHEALTYARTVLRDCACQRRVPAAKGCYQCLYVYRDQENLPLLDRARALELVDELLDAYSSLKRVDTIGTMTQSQVLESELEHRFVATLRERVREGGGQFEEITDGTWKLAVGSRKWLMRAQVTLGADLVAEPCRADFVLYCEPSTIDPGGKAPRPIAVFTDGLAFHVCPADARARLGVDARQRQGISASGQMLSWSLTWKDVVSPESPPVPRWLGDGPVLNNLQAIVQQLDQRQKQGEKLAGLLRVVDADPLRGLVAVLEVPTRLDTLARLAAFLLLQQGRRRARVTVDADQSSWRTRPEAPSGITTAVSEGDVVLRELGLGEHARILLDLPNARLGKLADDATELRATLRLEDEASLRKKPAFEQSWRQWLRAWNLFQTLPDATMTTHEAIVAGLSVFPSNEPSDATRAASERPPAKVASSTIELEALLRDVSPEVSGALRALFAKHPTRPLPAVPFELRRPEWGVHDDVEAGWSGEKVALYFDAQRDVAAALEARGWKVLAIERGVTPESLESALGWGEGAS
ncbi:MAG: DEAD/DEAH box helicase [Deltaproteobacteria bacterium]